MTTSMRSRIASIAIHARLAREGGVAVAAPAQRAAEKALNRRLVEQYGLDETAPDFADRLKWARSAHFKAMRLKAVGK